MTPEVSFPAFQPGSLSVKPIIPILIGKESKAIKIAEELFEKGILAPCVRWPAVAKGESRIRLSVISTHTKEQIDYLLKTLGEIGTANKVIS